MSVVSAFTSVGTLKVSYLHMIESVMPSIESVFSFVGIMFGSLLSMILSIYWAIKLYQLIKGQFKKTKKCRHKK